MENFKVPNMSKAMPHVSTEIGILNNLNGASHRPTSDMNESVSNQHSCSVCGAMWEEGTTKVDGAAAVCPVCGSPLTDPNQAGVQDSAVEPEAETQDIEQTKLESVFSDYLNLIESGQYESAKNCLASNGARAICESDDQGNSTVMLEKYVVKVDSTGKKTKVQVRTKKVKRTVAQKAALKKARKFANKGTAKAKRKKAMKARARMGINESIRKIQICNAVNSLLESQGMSINQKALERTITEAYHMNEAKVELPEDKALNALTNVLENHGLTLTDSSTEVIDGVLVVHATVQDIDSEVYLGNIADELESVVANYSVDYDDPEIDEEDKLVDIDFYFIPSLGVSEAVSVGDECTASKKANEACGTQKKNEACEPDDDKPDTKDSMSESTDVFESYAGGLSNVRCKLNPAFIKPGSIIFDADECTVFRAMTESVATDTGYQLSIDVYNSCNESLSDLAPGAEVTLTGKGNYYLLRNNPMA